MPGEDNQDTNNDHLLPDDFYEKAVVAKIDGEKKELTVAELKEAYQKKEASDKRFREAASAIDFRDDFVAGLREGNQNQIRRAFRNAGLSEQEIEALFQVPQEQEETVEIEDYDDDDDSGEGINAQLKAELIGMKRDLDAMKQAYIKAQESSREMGWKKQVFKAIDDDEILGKHISKLDEENAEWLQNLAYQAAIKASGRLPWGPRAIQAGLDEVKKRLNSLGALKPSEDDEDQATDYGPPRYRPPGLGASGSTVGRLHRPQPEKRVSVTDPNYGKSVFERWSRAIKKARR